MTDHRATRKRLIIAVLAAGAICLSSQTGASAAAAAPYTTARKFIYPPGLKAGEPFTPAVLAGNTLYVTGQVDKDPKTGRQPEGIAAQTRMAMDNVRSVLRAAGMDFGNVVSCHVHLVDMAQGCGSHTGH